MSLDSAVVGEIEFALAATVARRKRKGSMISEQDQRDIDNLIRDLRNARAQSEQADRNARTHAERVLTPITEYVAEIDQRIKTLDPAARIDLLPLEPQGNKFARELKLNGDKAGGWFSVIPGDPFIYFGGTLTLPTRCTISSGTS